MPRTDTLRCSTLRSSESAGCMKAHGDAKRGSPLAMRAKQVSQTTVMLDTGV
jgi:hypothetical protein